MVIGGGGGGRGAHPAPAQGSRECPCPNSDGWGSGVGSYPAPIHLLCFATPCLTCHAWMEQIVLREAPRELEWYTFSCATVIWPGANLCRGFICIFFTSSLPHSYTCASQGSNCHNPSLKLPGSICLACLGIATVEFGLYTLKRPLQMAYSRAFSQ